MRGLMEHCPITWREIEITTHLLAKQIMPYKKKYKWLYGIPRGGLIPVTILSHILGIKITTNLRPKTLVIDEICDSGKELAKKIYKDYDTAVLFKRYSSKFNPRYVGLVIRNKKWLIFPWENTKGVKNEIIP